MAPPVVVVGAGLAGLAAASCLAAHQQTVVVLEQHPQLGGRLATPVIGQGRWDAGAQFFTVRSQPFASLASGWVDGGVAYEWCRGFDQPPDGYPRYAGRRGMVDLAGQLAAGLEVRTNSAVRVVRPSRTGWQVQLLDGTTVEAKGVVLTPPVPESRSLIGRVDGGALDAIGYEPTLSVGVLLDGASAVPAPGGVQLSEGCFSFVADNLVKGVSPVPVVTLHATGDVSRRLWDSPDAVVVERLLAEGTRWLGSGVVDARLVRWPYARPIGLFESPCLALDRPAPVVFAGDAFGEARVEGATLSGLAAAAAILSMVTGRG